MYDYTSVLHFQARKKARFLDRIAISKKIASQKTQ